MTDKLAELEALLFVHGEPLPLEKVAAVLSLEREELAALFSQFHGALENDERGLALVSDVPIAELCEGKWEKRRVQLVTKPKFGGILEAFVKEELREELTPASLEALSLISYLGPITKSEVEYIRGVNSSFILRNLLLRGLIERELQSEGGGAYLYRVSMECMKHLGIQNSHDLPEYEKFRELFRTREEEVSSPVHET